MGKSCFRLKPNVKMLKWLFYWYRYSHKSVYGCYLNRNITPPLYSQKYWGINPMGRAWLRYEDSKTEAKLAPHPKCLGLFEPIIVWNEECLLKLSPLCRPLVARYVYYVNWTRFCLNWSNRWRRRPLLLLLTASTVMES